MIGNRARILIGLAALAIAITGCQASGGHSDGGKACSMKCDKCGTTASCEKMTCSKCKAECKTADIKMTCPGCHKEICSACKMMENADGSMKCPGCGKDVKCADMVVKCKCGAEMKGSDMMKCSKCGAKMTCSCAMKKG